MTSDNRRWDNTIWVEPAHQSEWTPCDRCNDVAVRKHKRVAGQMISRFTFTCADCLAQPGPRVPDPTSETFPHGFVPSSASDNRRWRFVPSSASDNRRWRLVAALQAAGIE